MKDRGEEGIEGPKLSRSRPLEDDSESQVFGGVIVLELDRRVVVFLRPSRPGRTRAIFPDCERATANHILGRPLLRDSRVDRILQGPGGQDIRSPDIPTPFTDVAGQIDDALLGPILLVETDQGGRDRTELALLSTFAWLRSGLALSPHT